MTAESPHNARVAEPECPRALQIGRPRSGSSPGRASEILNSSQLARYSWTGASLVADTSSVNQGISAWARPVTVTWATSPGRVVLSNLGMSERAGPGGGDEPVGGLDAGVRGGAVVRGDLTPLFGRGARQVAGV